MPQQPCFTAGQLEGICAALGETEGGLSGTEIGRTLAQIGVNDPEPQITKRKRLFNALAARQTTDQSGDRVLAFIAIALDPARYSGQRHILEARRAGVNVPLSFVGLEFGADGKFHRVAATTHLAEAEDRAGRLRSALSARGVHPDVLTFCRAELLRDNYFHAVLEASKSVAEKVRRLAGIDGDGAALFDAALGGNNPRLRINAYATQSDESEQRGFVQLLKGLFGTFRNPTAHEPRATWSMREEDALDLLSITSFVHRRLDAATRRP